MNAAVRKRAKKYAKELRTTTRQALKDIIEANKESDVALVDEWRAQVEHEMHNPADVADAYGYAERRRPESKKSKTPQNPSLRAVMVSHQHEAEKRAHDATRTALQAWSDEHQPTNGQSEQKKDHDNIVHTINYMWHGLSTEERLHKLKARYLWKELHPHYLRLFEDTVDATHTRLFSGAQQTA